MLQDCIITPNDEFEEYLNQIFDRFHILIDENTNKITVIDLGSRSNPSHTYIP